GVQRLLPARGAQAPAVVGLQAGETELGHRRREVVALRLAERQELGGHHHADGVAADILAAGVAAAVAEEAGHWADRAGVELAAQHIERRSASRTPGGFIEWH